MAIDEQHVALPKLYGAPAYARPPARRRDRRTALRSGRAADRGLPDRRGARASPDCSGARAWRARRRATSQVGLAGTGLADAAGRPRRLQPRARSRGRLARRRDWHSTPARPASRCSDRPRGSSSIGQSGGLISRWFQVRVLAPLPPSSRARGHESPQRLRGDVPMVSASARAPRSGRAARAAPGSSRRAPSGGTTAQAGDRSMVGSSVMIAA